MVVDTQDQSIRLVETLLELFMNYIVIDQGLTTESTWGLFQCLNLVKACDDAHMT